MDRTCKAHGKIETIGERVWRISLVTLLLMGLSLMCILMVNMPGSKAMAAALPALDPLGFAPRDRAALKAPQISTVAARTTQEPDFAVPPRHKQFGVQLASLGRRWAAATQCCSVADRSSGAMGCLVRLSRATLRRVIGEVAASFGPVTVNSTCRSVARNAAVGGARHSYHLSGSAADFRIHSNARAVHAYLSAHRSVGGLKHYGGGLFHVDVGPRRTW